MNKTVREAMKHILAHISTIPWYCADNIVHYRIYDEVNMEVNEDTRTDVDLYVGNAVAGSVCAARNTLRAAAE